MKFHCELENGPFRGHIWPTGCKLSITALVYGLNMLNIELQHAILCIINISKDTVLSDSTVNQNCNLYKQLACIASEPQLADSACCM